MRTVDQRNFKRAPQALAAIAMSGHYLFNSSTANDEGDEVTTSQTGRSAHDVVSAQDLSKTDKIEILAQREEDALSLQRASDEGMCGGERSKLDEVKSAQNRLTVKRAH